MSPITSQSRVHYRTVRLGGYRLLDFRVIGCILTGLVVIGLGVAGVTGLSKISDISENITGLAGQDPITPENYKNYRNNYQGVLGMLRLKRTGYGLDPTELPLDSSDRTWTGYNN